MTTLAQVEANRRNAQKSTGPKTARGKAIARQNAMKDGLTGGGIVLTLTDEIEVERLLPAYRAHYRPTNDIDEANVKRTLIETVRAQRCYADENKIKRDEMFRLMVCWVEDREAEVALLAGQLEARPEVIAPQLNRTLWGAYWQIERWEFLRSVVDSGVDWDESECTLALNLLGVAHSMRRKGLTKLDPPAGADPIEYRQGLAQQRIDWLYERAEGPLALIDEEQQIRTAHDPIMIEHPKLMRLRRCEAATLRRMQQARKELAERGSSENTSKHASSSGSEPNAPISRFPKARGSLVDEAPRRSLGAAPAPAPTPAPAPAPAPAPVPAPAPAPVRAPSAIAEDPTERLVPISRPTGWEAAMMTSAKAMSTPAEPSPAAVPEEVESYLDHFRRLQAIEAAEQLERQRGGPAPERGRSVASHAVQP